MPTLTSWQACQRYQGSCHDQADNQTVLKLQASPVLTVLAHALGQLAAHPAPKGAGPRLRLQARISAHPLLNSRVVKEPPPWRAQPLLLALSLTALVGLGPKPAVW